MLHLNWLKLQPKEGMFGLIKRQSHVEERTPLEIRWFNGKEKNEQVEKRGKETFITIVGQSETQKMTKLLFTL